MPSDTSAVQLIDDKTCRVRTKPCWICGQYSYLMIPVEAWRSFEIDDVPLDIAWPQGTRTDKVMITTGVHSKCWDEEYPNVDKGEPNA